MTDMPGLTEAQIERLALLLEELGEVQQAVGKILRHGMESCNPLLRAYAHSNRATLENELGDVLAAVHLLHYNDDVDMDAIQRAKHDKLRRVGQWLHYQSPATLAHALSFRGLTHD